MFKLIKFLFILFLGVISCACVNMVAVHELNTKASGYLEEGDLDSAISRLEASVDLDGNIYESRYNLANAYLRKGKIQKALENIEVAININKNEPIAFYTHGIIAQEAAEEIYEKTNEKGEKVPTVFKYKEDAIKAAKRYTKLLSDANESYERYISLLPNAEDTQQIYDIINENKQKIEQKLLEFELTLEK